MAVKIYHGPPGSYKTSSAMATEVVDCAIKGRLLITNCRGVTTESLTQALAKVRRGLLRNPIPVHPDFRVISFQQKQSEDEEKLRRFFHWAPNGAFFLLDEIQSLWPAQLTASQMRDYDAPEGLQLEGDKEPRPKTLQLAFDMHRHHGWDFAFTTPDIKKVHREIRGASEAAYKHKNLKLLGIPGWYTQHMHLAEDNGNASDIYSSSFKRVPRWVFTLYQSTTTGTFSDTGAGFALMASPKLLFFYCILGACVYWWGTTDRPVFLGGAHPQTRLESAQKAATENRNLSGDSYIPELPLNQSSLTARIVGIIEGPGGHALIEEAGYQFRVGLHQCRKDGLRQWSCDHLGQTVTERIPVTQALPPQPPAA